MFIVSLWGPFLLLLFLGGIWHLLRGSAPLFRSVRWNCSTEQKLWQLSRRLKLPSESHRFSNFASWPMSHGVEMTDNYLGSGTNYVARCGVVGQLCSYKLYDGYEDSRGPWVSLSARECYPLWFELARELSARDWVWRLALGLSPAVRSIDGGN